jgi:hypothetical protein
MSNHKRLHPLCLLSCIKIPLRIHKSLLPQTRFGRLSMIDWKGTRQTSRGNLIMHPFDLGRRSFDQALEHRRVPFHAFDFLCLYVHKRVLALLPPRIQASVSKSLRLPYPSFASWSVGWKKNPAKMPELDYQFVQKMRLQPNLCP